MKHPNSWPQWKRSNKMCAHERERESERAKSLVYDLVKPSKIKLIKRLCARSSVTEAILAIHSSRHIALLLRFIVAIRSRIVAVLRHELPINDGLTVRYTQWPIVDFCSLLIRRYQKFSQFPASLWLLRHWYRCASSQCSHFKICSILHFFSSPSSMPSSASTSLW